MSMTFRRRRSDLSGGWEKPFETAAAAAEFHRAFNLPMRQLPSTDIADDLAKLRVSLLEEEVGESSADRSVLQALDFMREYSALTHDHVSDQVVVCGPDGLPAVDEAGRPVTRVLDVSFASEDWQIGRAHV